MAYISCALINIVSILIFAYLADHFGKWWIVLFALFFWTNVKCKEKDK